MGGPNPASRNRALLYPRARAQLGVAQPSAGGRASAGSPYVDSTMREFTLTASERADYLELFDAFTDEAFLSNPAFSDPFAE